MSAKNTFNIIASTRNELAILNSQHEKIGWKKQGITYKNEQPPQYVQKYKCKKPQLQFEKKQYPNRILSQYAELNKSGENHGLFFKWWSSGVLEQEGTYLNGKAHGTWTFYYKNGNPISKGNIVEGHYEGPWKIWYSDKSLQSELSYKNNLKDGICVTISPNGKEKSQVIYEDGHMKDGVWTSWYENGQKNMEIVFSDQKRNGRRTVWRENGEKKQEAEYIDNENEGICQCWRLDGVHNTCSLSDIKNWVGKY